MTFVDMFHPESAAIKKPAIEMRATARDNSHPPTLSALCCIRNPKNVLDDVHKKKYYM
jgi:hypothetical protein